MNSYLYVSTLDVNYSGIGLNEGRKFPALKGDAKVVPAPSQDQALTYSPHARKELRRSRLDICHELMEVIHEKGEIGPTQLMYKANLSWKTFTELLEYLSGRDLVRSSKVGARYVLSLTELGNTCLRDLDNARRILVAEEPPGQFFAF
jgi:predicted transcriptional regulator